MYSRMRQRLKHKAFAAITRTMGDENGCVLLPVLRGPARGLRFRLDLQTSIESAYFFGSYELPILRQIARICQKGWTVWDCGAYLGFYTASFARLVGPEGHVVAFEPDPWNMGRTRENIALNGFGNVQFVQAAIGAPVSEVDFILSDNTNSHIPGTYVGATPEEYAEIEQCNARVRVPCLSLDQAYLDEAIPHPHLLKLDIEGAEREALQHAERLIHEVSPLIVLELHNPECDAVAWQFAQTMGYSLRSLTDGRVLQASEDVCGTVLCSPTR